MKSIQTKFIVLILGCVLLSTAIIGGAGIDKARRVVDADSAQIMNLTCREKAGEINALLSRIEQSVQTVARYSQDELDSLDRLKNEEGYLEDYTSKVQNVAINAANNTEGVLAVYLRFNPEFTPPTSGIFWSRTEVDGTFHENVPTDFSSYSHTDVERVGWYYIPMENGKATWMAPYTNKNLKVEMISYVIPLFMNSEVVGVVGMDINYEVITNHVKSMGIYESGYAFLSDVEGKVMYHKELKLGSSMAGEDKSLIPVVVELKEDSTGKSLFKYDWRGEEKQLAFCSLKNGMRLALAAPTSEIDAAKEDLKLQIFIAFLVISCLAILMTVLMTRRLIRPLRDLNDAAKKIAGGDLGISLKIPKTKDEVGALADSFQQTVNHLKKYIDYINGLAYRDALTGIKNKTAYQEKIHQIEEQMHLSRPEFAVIVFDINGLKQVNDNYGHDFGDMLIVDACKLICMSFKHSPVYRIGGDEFVAILEGSELEHYSECLEDFEKRIKDFNKRARVETRVSIARGIAIFNYESDLVFNNVFKRADDAMYQNKIAMKRIDIEGK